MLLRYIYMLEKTKTAMAAELIKSVIHIDPAPMPGAGLANIAKALVDDVKDFTKERNRNKV